MGYYDANQCVKIGRHLRLYIDVAALARLCEFDYRELAAGKIGADRRPFL